LHLPDSFQIFGLQVFVGPATENYSRTPAAHRGVKVESQGNGLGSGT
jgi:hypothetical protein